MAANFSTGSLVENGRSKKGEENLSHSGGKFCNNNNSLWRAKYQMCTKYQNWINVTCCVRNQGNFDENIEEYIDTLTIDELNRILKGF